jgi:hypothetical protein
MALAPLMREQIFLLFLFVPLKFFFVVFVQAIFLLVL